MLNRLTELLTPTRTAGRITAINGSIMTVATTQGSRNISHLQGSTVGDQVAIEANQATLNHARKGLQKYQV